MRRAFFSSLIILSLLLIAVGCRSAADTNRPETQSQFGVRMARMNLWREAEFRFRRAVQLDPNDAQAHNNLAVALEAIGDFEGAQKQYVEALRLDRSNQHIQKNYSRFREFTKKRDAATVTAASAATTTAAAPSAATTTPPATTTTPATTDTATPTDTATTTTTNPPDGGSR